MLNAAGVHAECKEGTTRLRERDNPPLGPYIRTMPRALRWS